MHEILIHLVIIGKDPIKNEFAIGLIKGRQYETISIAINNEPEIQACNLSTKYINAPLELYEIRKQTFLTSKETIHLIYAATVPNNINLKNGLTWIPIHMLSQLEFTNEIEKDIILEGIKL